MRRPNTLSDFPTPGVERLQPISLLNANCKSAPSDENRPLDKLQPTLRLNANCRRRGRFSSPPQKFYFWHTSLHGSEVEQSDQRAFTLEEHLVIMDKKRLYRLEVTPNAYHIIEAEAFLCGRTLKSIASEILTSHSSKEALSLAASKLEGGKIKEPEKQRDEKPKDQMIIEPKCAPVHVADISPKKRRLSANPDALQQIKTLWTQSPRPSLAKMSEQIGYHKATIHDAIQRMKAKGELVD